MPSVPQRIMAGQRAAVCGLVIVGVSLGAACKIAGAPYKAMLSALPAGWHTKQKPPHKWKGERLAALERAYGDRSMSVELVARTFKIHSSYLRGLARRHGWKRRPQGMVSNETRLMYRRLRPFAGSKALAGVES